MSALPPEAEVRVAGRASAVECAALEIAQIGADVGGEGDLGIVLGRIVDHPAGVADAPERAGIVRDAVEHLMRDAVGVANIGGLDRLDVKLAQIARADVGAQVAAERDRVVVDVPPADRPWRPDADVDVFDRASESAGGEDESGVLVGRLGSAVEVVGRRVSVRADHVHAATVELGLVPVGGVVGTGDYDPADVLFQRQLEHVEDHVDVGPLGVVAVRRAHRAPVFGQPLQRRCADAVGIPAEASVDHRVDAGEMLPVGIDVGVAEIGYDYIVYDSVAGVVCDIEADQVVTLAQRRQKLARNGASGAGQQHLASGHDGSDAGLQGSAEAARHTTQGPVVNPSG